MICVDRTTRRHFVHVGQPSNQKAAQPSRTRKIRCVCGGAGGAFLFQPPVVSVGCLIERDGQRHEHDRRVREGAVTRSGFVPTWLQSRGGPASDDKSRCIPNEMRSGATIGLVAGAVRIWRA